MRECGPALKLRVTGLTLGPTALAERSAEIGIESLGIEPRAAAPRTGRPVGIALTCGAGPSSPASTRRPRRWLAWEDDPLLSTPMRYAVNVSLVLWVLNPL